MLEPFEFFEVHENDRILKLHPNLKINNSPAFYLLLRGIVGNIKIKQTFREVTFQQETDYLNLNSHASLLSSKSNLKTKTIKNDLKYEIQNLVEILKVRCKSNLEILPNYISDTFTIEDLSNVLLDKKIINRNKGFFESLNNEFCNFHYHTFKQNHTVAFLHLYRILEFVSYTFPIMYVASTKDFSRSFDKLKSLFSGEKDQGELKVFKYFIEKIISVEKNYEDLSIDIDIVSDLEEYNKRIYKTITHICDKDVFDESKSISDSRVSIKFLEFSSFMITVRNRYFHLKNSQGNNIHTVDIIDSDYFFSLINKQCAYFLSLITVEIIRNSHLNQ